MAVRTTALAAAVFTAAVAVYALAESRRVCGLRRELVRERASHRLMTGCLVRDLEVFRCRLGQVVAQQAVVAAAGQVVAESLAHYDETTPPMEGGTR